jgi:signal transduction histidine kinase
MGAVSSSVRRLTMLYILALSLIALLSILGQGLIQLALQQAPNDTAVVNIAGRQRMFSQKVSKAALAIEVGVLTTDREAQQYAIEELRSTIVQWRYEHTALLNGDTTYGLPDENSSEVIHLFNTLEPHYRAMLNGSMSLLASLNAPTPPSHAMIATSVHSILMEEPTYLTIMNTIVLQYQHESTARIHQLKNIEYVLLAIMLFVLLGEGFFVFHPAIKKIRAALAEQAEAKQHIAVSYEEQRQLNQLKDQLLLNVNHELRTLMTSVYGYLELLRDHNGQLDAKTQDIFFEQAIKGCEEFQVHVNVVLNTLKVGNNARPLSVERLSIAQVVTAVLDLFDPIKKHGYTIEHTIPDTLFVQADRQSLYQVLRNLISNAFKYAPQGTTIAIRASLHEQEETPLVHIAVRDEGHGIPSAEIPLLFNRFVRLQRDLNSSVNGSGLGLYISKQLVEAMHGRIWVESTGIDGEGSCFFIELPASVIVPEPSDKEARHETVVRV